MEVKQLVINPAVLLKVDINNPYKVELVDNLLMTPAIREETLLPFISSLLESLSDNKNCADPAVTRYVLNEVIYSANFSI